MRTYLVVIDDSPEASLALRFAARRAARTGGGVTVLAIIPPQDFVAFGGVQATIEAEAREHAEQLIAAADSATPRSDSQLADMLQEQGIDCARRTVAKYREGLRIPVASLRRAAA